MSSVAATPIMTAIMQTTDTHHFIQIMTAIMPIPFDTHSIPFDTMESMVSMVSDRPENIYVAPLLPAFQTRMEYSVRVLGNVSGKWKQL